MKSLPVQQERSPGGTLTLVQVLDYSTAKTAREGRECSGYSQHCDEMWPFGDTEVEGARDSTSEDGHLAEALQRAASRRTLYIQAHLDGQKSFHMLAIFSGIRWLHCSRLQRCCKVCLCSDAHA